MGKGGEGLLRKESGTKSIQKRVLKRKKAETQAKKKRYRKIKKKKSSLYIGKGKKEGTFRGSKVSL